MEHPTIHTVIFDLGGVLIDWNPRHLYRKIFDKEEKMEFFLSEICTSDWNEQQDAGRPLEEATNMLVERHPDHKEEIRAYYGRWEEMLGGAIEGTVNILKRLHEQNDHRLYALTNWSAETFPIAEDRYDFLNIFEGILVSGQEKIKKPDPIIYQTLIRRYNIEPAGSIFIDDNHRNVIAAREEHIQAVLFESPKQLEEDLAKLGVLR